uniref:Leucine-rich repeat-containing N-terminal plant-type domain-containing protein n=1 Tax=Manihot esculenta TaxID=3983 RepID=A0A199UCV4_MANES
MGTSTVNVIEILALLILLQSVSSFCNGDNFNGSCIKTEREALVKFKSSLFNNSNSLPSWEGDDCCRWHGLSIIGDVSHVNFTSLEVLDLGLNNFHSTIPSWLYNITKLQNLDLYSSAFRGSLSTDISNLNSLASLNAGFNSLEGNIPNTLNRLCNLIELHLGYNKFSGEISGTFSNSSGCIKNSLENLILLNNSFSGSIPDNLGQFKRLKGLYLSKNSFWGSIPVSIGQLYNLERLGLSKNSLHGEVSELHLLNLRSLIELSVDGNSLVFDIDPEWIPPFQLSSIDLSSCEVGPSLPQWLKTQKHIRFLEMSNASISDNIPDWFENISSNIVGLDLSYNQLFGTLPTFRKLNTPYANEYRIILLKSNQFDGFLTCSHFDATILDISNNLLHGQIPQNLSEMMPSLQLLSLSNNYLNGTVPATLCRSGSLQILDLSNNHLSGIIPSCWGNLPSLTVIDFSSNMLSGDVPMSLGSQESLVSLHLQNNTLQGKIPMSLRYLESLETLDLSMNAFDGFIPSWIGESLSSLKVLSIHSNKFEGRIPSCWGNLPSLTVIDFSSNMLSGDVPMSLGSQESLVSLHLENNTLQGKIPMSLRNLESLETLDLSMNSFDGFIPWWIGESLSSLKVLSVHSNKFEGEIPLQLCYLASLRILNLANNVMTGTIPICFGNFTAIAMHEQKGHWEYYSNAVPYVGFVRGYGENVQVYVKGIELEYTSTLRFLYSIDLSGNNFILNLSTNKLDGHIPWNIGKLSLLESLDLSENELSGSIPFSISDLNFLSHLNLSFNHLSGRIPKGNQLQTLDDKSIYIGNDGLYELPKGHEKGGTTRKDDSEMVWFYSGMGMGFAAGFVGVCSILYFNDSWRCAWFGLVDRVYNKLWVTIAIKANQVKRKFVRNKLEGNA